MVQQTRPSRIHQPGSVYLRHLGELSLRRPFHLCCCRGNLRDDHRVVWIESMDPKQVTQPPTEPQLQSHSQSQLSSFPTVLAHLGVARLLTRPQNTQAYRIEIKESDAAIIQMMRKVMLGIKRRVEKLL